MKAKNLKKLVNSIPSSVRITQNVSYEVVFIDDFADGLTLGECRHDIKQIVIKKGLNNSLTLRTFIHEILHATAMENDFVLTENLTLALEDGLWRLIRLNNIVDVLCKLI